MINNSLFKKSRTLLLIFIILVLSGCTGESGPETGSVRSNWEADTLCSAVDRVLDNIISDLSMEIHSNKVIEGAEGTVTVSGEKSRDYSASSSSVSDTHTCDITLVFNKYRYSSSTTDNGGNSSIKGFFTAMTSQTEILITGTITYYVYDHSYTTASSYSSSYNKRASGTDVYISGYELDDGDYIVSDTFSFYFSDKNDNSFSLKGWVEGSDGIRYSFD